MSDTQNSQTTATHLDHSPEDVTKSSYYQHLQTELAQKATEQVAQAQKQGYKPQIVEDMVDIKSSLSWAKNDKGELEVKTNSGSINTTSITMRPGKVDFLSYSVNIASKKGFILDSYLKSFVQARSHNLLLSKLAQFKCGYYLMMLVFMGVGFEEIEKLRKQALSDSIAENEANFNENEYNHEMLMIVSGGKALKRQLEVISEIREQLKKNMQSLGKSEAYSAIQVARIQETQCRRVYDEFMQEKSNLEYQVEFL